MEEIWADIPGFEDYYKVSNMGRIFHKKNNEVLTGVGTSVTLFKNNRQYGYERSRLVATAFIPNPLNLPIVEHIDGDRLNNRVDNLKWVEQNERRKERITNKLRDKNADRYGIIYCYGPDGQYFEARSQREATSMTGVSQSSVGYAIHNETAPRGWRFVRDSNG